MFLLSPKKLCRGIELIVVLDENRCFFVLDKLFWYIGVNIYFYFNIYLISQALWVWSLLIFYCWLWISSSIDDFIPSIYYFWAVSLSYRFSILFNISYDSLDCFYITYYFYYIFFLYICIYCYLFYICCFCYYYFLLSLSGI